MYQFPIGMIIDCLQSDFEGGFYGNEFDLAKDIETDVVMTHIGVVPNDKNHDRYKIMQSDF